MDFALLNLCFKLFLASRILDQLNLHFTDFYVDKKTKLDFIGFLVFALFSKFPPCNNENLFNNLKKI